MNACHCVNPPLHGHCSQFLDFYIRAYIKGARKAKEGRAANGRQPAGPTGEPAKEAKKTK